MLDGKKKCMHKEEENSLLWTRKKKKRPPKAILAVTETKGCDKRISKTRVNYKNITPLIQF